MFFHEPFIYRFIENWTIRRENTEHIWQMPKLKQIHNENRGSGQRFRWKAEISTRRR